MKSALQLTAAGLIALFLASCGTNGTHTAGGSSGGTGPFDSRGNYREEWADNPSKWKSGSGSVPAKPGESLDIGASDEPPPDSVPLPTASNTRQVNDIGPAPVITKTSSKPSSKPSSTVVHKTTTTSASTASKTKPKTTSAAVASKTKPKTPSKTTVSAKPKPKSSASARYTIKKGDTLSAIASRNGTSVAALQRANGIKGAMIQPGKSLVIPK